MKEREVRGETDAGMARFPKSWMAVCSAELREARINKRNTGKRVDITDVKKARAQWRDVNEARARGHGGD